MATKPKGPRHILVPVKPTTKHTTMLKPDQDEATSVVDLPPGGDGVASHPVITPVETCTTDAAATASAAPGALIPTDLPAATDPTADGTNAGSNVTGESSTVASGEEKDVKPNDLELNDPESQLITASGSMESSSIVTNPDVSLSDALGILPMDPGTLPLPVVDSGLLDKQSQDLEDSEPVIPVRRGRKPKKVIVSEKPARTIDQIPDLPVFADEADKMDFEQRLNVDLSQVNPMFKTHHIKQSMNEKASPSSSRASDQLTVYSCVECDKVFMSLSHMRLHCLIHTNLKPYQCAKCDYATNTKGRQ